MLAGARFATHPNIMTLTNTGAGLPVGIFLLALLTIVAKGRSRLGRAAGALRVILCVFYGLLVLAGVGGVALSVWMAVASRGKAMLLVVLILPLSIFLITAGSRLFRFVLSPLPAPRKPLASSSGWENVAAAAENARNTGVTPHLQPAALRKTDAG